MRKIKEADPIVIDFLKNIFVSNQDEEEGVFQTDEEKEDPKVFIPKLFCQVGDKKSGRPGRKFSMADKGKPPPPWFVFVSVFVFPIHFWIAIFINFQKMYRLGSLGQGVLVSFGRVLP